MTTHCALIVPPFGVAVDHCPIITSRVFCLFSIFPHSAITPFPISCQLGILDSIGAIGVVLGGVTTHCALIVPPFGVALAGI